MIHVKSTLFAMTMGALQQQKKLEEFYIPYS